MFSLFVIFDAIGRVQNLWTCAAALRQLEGLSAAARLLGVVLGVVLILNPFGAMETLVMAIGVIP